MTRNDDSSAAPGHRAHPHPPRSFTVQGAGPLIGILSEGLGVSRRAAKRRLDERSVLVNGRRVWMARHPLQPGDTVEVVAVATVERAASLTILYAGGNYLVVDKPAGLTTTGANSVEARLQAQRQEPGLSAVHRLDRDTTGCLLFARSESARAAAVEAFRRDAVVKIYEALVLGAVPDRIKEIRVPIEGRRAVTRIEVIGAGRGVSHLRIRILTGRTHQIRRHLHGAGHPVLGDRGYGTARRLPELLREIRRPMLHAARLSLSLPEGDAAGIEVASPRPADFSEWLEKLGIRPCEKAVRSGRGGGRRGGRAVSCGGGT